ncbi:MAG TPA: hypothetical protein VK852_00395 [Desulfobacterales bacterium]|jgi:hypothetical protein|nr:hypothetical protein [Desulfobacterales bacterium]
MPPKSPLIRVHVNIELAAETLQTVVATCKARAGADQQARYRVDTADALAGLISRFLQDAGFDQYCKDPNHY